MPKKEVNNAVSAGRLVIIDLLLLYAVCADFRDYFSCCCLAIKNASSPWVSSICCNIVIVHPKPVLSTVPSIPPRAYRVLISAIESARVTILPWRLARRRAIMWHEARKQENKVRELLVDYRTRTQQRKGYHEKNVSFSFSEPGGTGYTGGTWRDYNIFRWFPENFSHAIVATARQTVHSALRSSRRNSCWQPCHHVRFLYYNSLLLLYVYFVMCVSTHSILTVIL